MATQAITSRYALALKAKGKSFSVFFPLDVNGKVQNYLFEFSIEDVMT